MLHSPKLLQINANIKDSLAKRKSLQSGKILKTRFAPSPTGYLHLGHVVSMIYVWGLGRAHGLEILLRIEDHDQGRCRPEFTTAIHEDLNWLGFKPDLVTPPQSARSQIYEKYIHKLSPLVYGCKCTRREIAQISAQGDQLYPGTCRDLGYPLTSGVGWRLKIPDTSQIFDDALCGHQTQIPAQQCGDILLRERQGNWTYQFAVTCDDFDQEIALVIRGEDLMESTGRQLVLRHLLSKDILVAPSSPVFAHHPLAVDAEGKKLSKRFLSESIRSRRNSGIVANEIIIDALLASGLVSNQVSRDALPNSVDELAKWFSDHMSDQ